jgi:hypothetical protein
LTILILLALSTPADAVLLQLGLRGGYAHTSGEVFSGSGDPGGSGLYGVVASLSPIPGLEAEFAYERTTTEFDFTGAAYEDAFFDGSADLEQQLYALTAKGHIPIAGPLVSLHVGAGVSSHRLDLAIDSDADLGEAFDSIARDRDEWAWHAVAGLGVGLGSLPLRAYGEARYEDIGGTVTPTVSSVYAGLNFVFR